MILPRLLILTLVFGVTARVEAGGIASLVPSLTDVLLELGAADRICAVSRYCQLPDSLEELPRIGAYLDPDLESLISLQPDLVLLSASDMALESRLRSLGVNVHIQPQDRIEQVLDGIRALGELLDCPARAESLARDLEQTLQPVEVAGARPGVLIVASRDVQAGAPAHVWAIGKGSWLCELIELAGARCVIPDHQPAMPAYSREGFIALDPDLIIDLWPVLPEGRDIVSLEEDWLNWPELRAVQLGRIVVLSERELVVPGPGLAVAMRLLQRELALLEKVTP